jgi:hypothetical protein
MSQAVTEVPSGGAEVTLAFKMGTVVEADNAGQAAGWRV